MQERNRYLDHLVDPRFQGANRLLVLSFEKSTDRTSYKRYYLPRVEIKTYNVMIDGQKFVDQPIKIILRTYGNIQKITAGQGDYYTTGCLLDYPNFENFYKMIAIDLSKQQALDVNPKVMQQINFTGSLKRNKNTTTFFMIEEAKETIFDFSQETVQVL